MGSAGIEAARIEILSLGLSKLSPAFRRRICEMVGHEAYREAGDVGRDLEQYGSGPVRDEVVGWQQAASDLSKKARAIEKIS